MRSVTDDTRGTTWRGPFARKLVGVVLLGLLLALMATSYVDFVDYVEHDPGFCAECHVTQNQYELWSRSEHRDVPCQACHEQTQAEALATLQRFVFSASPDDAEPLHSPPVHSTSCAACHRHNDEDWGQIGKSIGHVVHAERSEISCLSCHARTMHRFSTAQDGCSSCHAEHVAESSGMAALHCLACHNFLTDEETLRPSRAICLDCHRSSGVEDGVFPPNAAMASLPCSACHRPHEGEGATLVHCIDCHDLVGMRGLHAVQAHAHCTDCHQPHTWRPTVEQCVGCHRSTNAACETRGTCWDCHDTTPKPAGAPQAVPAAGP